MGLENRIVYDLVDVIEEKCKLRQALIKDKRFDELFLLPAAQTRDKNAINEEQMKELTKKLKEEFDYVLIDCPAGIEQGFKNAVSGADRAIVVTTPIKSIDNKSTISSTSIISPFFTIEGLKRLTINSGFFISADSNNPIILSASLIADISAVVTTIALSAPETAYIEIAKRVLGENVDVTIPGREKGFFAKIKSLFKKN